MGAGEVSESAAARRAPGVLPALLARCAVPEEEAWRLRVAHWLLAEGLPQPWPAVAVQLLSVGAPPELLPAFAGMLEQADALGVASPRDAFAEGATVLVWVDGTQVRGMGRWKRGRIRAVTSAVPAPAPVPAEEAEGVDGGAPAALPTASEKAAGKAQSGVLYDVDLDDTVAAAGTDLKSVPATRVLSSGTSGVGAMLRKAASLCRPEVVRMLLDAGVSVFCSDEHASTPLLHAVRPEAVESGAAAGRPWGALVDVCKLLVERGADVDSRNIWRQNAHDFAMVATSGRSGDVAIVRAMKPSTSDKEVAADDGGLTPLMLAARSGDEAKVKLVLLNNASSNLTAAVASKGDGSNKGTPRTPRAGGLGPGGKATPRSEKAVDAQTDEGSSALSMACEEGHAKVVTLLLGKNAQPNLVDGDKRTPLMHAAKGGWAEVVAALVKAKADLTIEREGMRAMHLAAQHGHAPVIRVLLKAGGSATYASEEVRRTCPLWLAARYGQLAAVHELLKAAADPGAGDKSEETVLMGAARSGHAEVLQLPDPRAGLLSLPRHPERAPLPRIHQVVRVLLDAKAAIDSCDSKGKSALIRAAIAGQSRVASQLLSRGAVADLCDADGVTPLLAASAHGHEATVQLLLREEADVNHRAQPVSHAPPPASPPPSLCLSSLRSLPRARRRAPR
jgi:ankyrin repeat protein